MEYFTFDTYGTKHCSLFVTGGGGGGFQPKSRSIFNFSANIN